MQTCAELSAGNLNRTFIAALCLAVIALAAGCATAPKQTVQAPVYFEDKCRAALMDGAHAMSMCSREHVLAQMENRAADYGKARDTLAKSLAMLEPGKQSPAKPQYEQAAQCFDTALAGIDRIMAAQKSGDKDEEALGWEMFDQSATNLLLVLEPYMNPEVKGRAHAN